MDFYGMMLERMMNPGGGGGDEPTGTIDIVSNGNHNVKSYATANVSVPNSYTAEDEDKVVSNGALVAQISQTITENGTYDTTLVDELIANISGDGGGAVIADEEFQQTGGSTHTTSISEIITVSGDYFILAIGYSDSTTVQINGITQTNSCDFNSNYQHHYAKKVSLQQGDIVSVNISGGGKGYHRATLIRINGGGGGVSDNNMLFHFDTDYSNEGKSNVAFFQVTGLEISNEQSKFGNGSLKCGTTQEYYNIALGHGLELGNDDFTLDFWCYPTNISGSSERVPVAFSYRSLAIYLKATGLEVAVAKSNSSWFDTGWTAVTFTNNQWYHIAIVRNGTDLHYFVDGVKIKTLDFGSDAFAPMTYLTLGSNTYSYGDRRFNGYIDELRLKIGEAVWTEDFTPPTQPYQ